MLSTTGILLANVRPDSVILLPAIGVLLLLWLTTKDRSRKKNMVLLYAGALFLLLVPFAACNRHHAGEFGITASGGRNFYLASNTGNPLPYYRPADFASSNPTTQGIPLTIEAARRCGRPLTVGQASTFRVVETLREAMDQPNAF